MKKKFHLKKVIILLGILVVAVAIMNQQKTKQLTYYNLAPSPSPTIKPIPLPANLTDEEKFILNPPSAEASRSALNKHAKIVAKLAKEGNILGINNCLPTPLVLQVKQGDQLTIKNGDSKHKIMFDEEHVYELPTNNSLTLKASFKYGTGDYGYVCEGSEGRRIVGFLHVIQ